MINNRTMQDPVGAQLPSFETANHLAEAMIISASSSTWPKSGQIAITDDYLEAEPEGRHIERASCRRACMGRGLDHLSIVAVKSLRNACRFVRAIYLDTEIELRLYAVASNLLRRLDAGIEADPAAHPNRAGEPNLL
jgi:hypothetical protein